MPGQDTAEIKIIGSEDPSYPMSSFDGSLGTMWVSAPVTTTRNQL